MRKSASSPVAAPVPVEHGVPSEHAEQVDFFQKVRALYPECPDLAFLLFAIPNGGLRDRITAARLRAEGVRSGVPDICCAIPCGGCHGLYLEMKKTRCGRVSEAQKEIISRLKARGYRVETPKGAAAAFAILKDYLGL